MKTAANLVTLLALALALVCATGADDTRLTRADALVLVNSQSDGYSDFVQLVDPYLKNFGIPYTILDISTTPVAADIADYSVIIVGHKRLDVTHGYLGAEEQGYISSAVQQGTGLVNFDSDLCDDSLTPRYSFVQDIFGFGYNAPIQSSGVKFADGSAMIDCSDDGHQLPVLATTTQVSDLNPNDGQWTEFSWAGRPFAAVFAGVDEESIGLPEMRFHADGLANGEYAVSANLYTWGSGLNMRYYYGYTRENPKTSYVDAAYGPTTRYQFTEFSLGTVSVTNGTFDIYVQDADLLPGTGSYPLFGWAWVKLQPTAPSSVSPSYITMHHAVGQSIATGTMSLANLALSGSSNSSVISSEYPLLPTTSYGSGRAVQWASYDWMSPSVLGSVSGMDDLVWRSIVWAARKPFVMRCMPNLLTMRVDDTAGPLWWVHTANDAGYKPWMGLFLHNLGEGTAWELSGLVNSGQATASVHAFTTNNFFYFDHSGTSLPDEVVAANYAEGTAWHSIFNVPISKYALPHWYEIGPNAFAGLADWGVQFVGLQMDPGTSYGSPWVVGGPYRLFGPRGWSDESRPMYYADFVSVPGHPEFDGRFFNCATEIRDDAGYEWYPDNDVQGSIGRGARQLRRALDSLVLPTLFTHEYYVQAITPDNWSAILQGINSSIAPYKPIYTTLDQACQYARALHTSKATSSVYDVERDRLTTTLEGTTDISTVFSVFFGNATEPGDKLVGVPVFSGSTQVVANLVNNPPTLDHISITPPSALVDSDKTVGFAAQGYDSAGSPVPDLTYSWSVDGGGTIDQSGQFTAGAAAGTYTVTAAADGISGSASVTVYLDTTPPTVTWGSPTPPANALGWNNGPVTIPYAASDDHSGVASALPASPLAFTGEGYNQTLVVTVTDLAGNSATFTSTPAINIDLTAPVSSAATSGTSGANGWWRSGVAVTLASADTLSGVAGIYYTLDGGAQNTYAAPFTIDADGMHTVSFWSVDKAGNAEPPKTIAVNIDRTAPTIAWGPRTPAANSFGWNNGPVTLPYTASDDHSGVASAVPASPISFTGEGYNQTRVVTVTDLAGNSGAFTSTPAINIDLTAPVTSAATSGTSGTGGWWKSSVTVTLASADALSGLASIYYTVDGGTQKTYDAPFTIDADGMHTVSFWSVDKAGNAETPKNIAVNIDRTAPTVVWGPRTPAANSFGWNKTTPVYIPYTTVDALSGVASATPASPLSFTSQGTAQTKSVTVKDKVGNAATIASAAVNIDTGVPAISAKATPASVVRRDYGTQAVTVYGSISDSLSGVNPASGTYRIKDSKSSTVLAGTFSTALTGAYSFIVNLSISNTGWTNRIYTITVTGQDKAGNARSTSTTFTVK